MAEEHVQTVICPNCGVYWTGRFDKTPPKEALCRNCMLKRDRQDESIHPDLTIRSGRY